MKKDMESVVAAYLSKINISVSQMYWRRLIASHPDYPSLLSLSETLGQLGIRHQTARVERERLPDIPFPFLLQTDEKGGDLKLIRKPNDLERLKPASEEERAAVVLQAEPGQNIAGQENQKQLDTERWNQTLSVLLLLSAAGLLLLGLSTTFSWLYIALVATSLAGAGTGWLLLARDLGIRYDAVEAFCTSGKTSGCDQLLRSDEATIFGRFTFSDAAAGYFIAQFAILTILLPHLQVTLSWLVALAVPAALTLPVVGWSLYVQAFRKKAWCRLCMVINGLLILQAGVFAMILQGSISGLADLSLLPFGWTLFWFALVTSALLLYMARAAEAETFFWEAAKVGRVKNTPTLFATQLASQKNVDTSPWPEEIRLGEQDAPVQLLMAASTGCGPCRQGFESARNLLRLYPGMVSLRIRLMTKAGKNGQGPSLDELLLARWRHHIYGSTEESALAEKLFTDWYEMMDPERFIEAYPVETNGSDAAVRKLQNRHGEWMKQAGVKATPTFFIGGYPLPKHYSLEDLKALIPGLTMQMKRAEPGAPKMDALSQAEWGQMAYPGPAQSAGSAKAKL